MHRNVFKKHRRQIQIKGGDGRIQIKLYNIYRNPTLLFQKEERVKNINTPREIRIPVQSLKKLKDFIRDEVRYNLISPNTT